MEPKFKNTINLPSAGYYGLKDLNDTLFDAGPFSPRNLSAHGHADALSFELTIDKKEFLLIQAYLLTTAEIYASIQDQHPLTIHYRLMV